MAVDNTRAAVSHGEVIRKNRKLTVVRKGHGARNDDVLMATSPDFAVLGNSVDPKWNMKYKDIGKMLHRQYGNIRYTEGDPISDRTQQINDQNMNQRFDYLLDRQKVVNELMGNDQQYKNASDTQAFEAAAQGGEIPRFGLGGFIRKHPYIAAHVGLGIGASGTALTYYLYKMWQQKQQEAAMREAAVQTGSDDEPLTEPGSELSPDVSDVEGLPDPTLAPQLPKLPPNGAPPELADGGDVPRYGSGGRKFPWLPVGIAGGTAVGAGLGAYLHHLYRKYIREESTWAGHHQAGNSAADIPPEYKGSKNPEKEIMQVLAQDEAIRQQQQQEEAAQDQVDPMQGTTFRDLISRVAPDRLENEAVASGGRVPRFGGGGQNFREGSQPTPFPWLPAGILGGGLVGTGIGALAHYLYEKYRAKPVMEREKMFREEEVEPGVFKTPSGRPSRLGGKVGDTKWSNMSPAYMHDKQKSREDAQIERKKQEAITAGERQFTISKPQYMPMTEVDPLQVLDSDDMLSSAGDYPSDASGGSVPRYGLGGFMRRHPVISTIGGLGLGTWGGIGLHRLASYLYDRWKKDDPLGKPKLKISDPVSFRTEGGYLDSPLGPLPKGRDEGLSGRMRVYNTKKEMLRTSVPTTLVDTEPHIGGIHNPYDLPEDFLQAPYVSKPPPLDIPILESPAVASGGIVPRYDPGTTTTAPVAPTGPIPPATTNALVDANQTEQSVKEDREEARRRRLALSITGLYDLLSGSGQDTAPEHFTGHFVSPHLNPYGPAAGQAILDGIPHDDAAMQEIADQAAVERMDASRISDPLLRAHSLQSSGQNRLTQSLKARELYDQLRQQGMKDYATTMSSIGAQDAAAMNAADVYNANERGHIDELNSRALAAAAALKRQNRQEQSKDLNSIIESVLDHKAAVNQGARWAGKEGKAMGDVITKLIDKYKKKKK